MVNKYAIINTRLNQMNATLIEQLSGRQGDSGRVVFFALKDGDLPHDISNQKVEIIVKDAQGKIKIISTINNLISSVGGLFSMVIPSELYQSAGDIEEGYIRVSSSENIVISSIPITFKVVANNIIMTSNASKDYIDSVQKLVDESNDTIKILGNNIDSQTLAFKALQNSLQNMNEAINKQQMPTLSGSNTFSGDNAFLNPLRATLKPVILTDGTDFNSLTNPGHYQASGTFPNSPYPTTASAYDIDVEKLSNGFTIQKMTIFNTNSSNIFTRAKVGTSWQGYQRYRFNKNFTDVVIKKIYANGINMVLMRTDNIVSFNIQSYEDNTKYASYLSKWTDSGLIPLGFRPAGVINIPAEHGDGVKPDGSKVKPADGLLAIGIDGGIITRFFEIPLPTAEIGTVKFLQASATWLTGDSFPQDS